MSRTAATEPAPGTRRVSRSRAVAFVVGFVIVLIVPLAASTKEITAAQIDRTKVADVARAWAAPAAWEIEAVDPREGGFRIHASGPPPSPDPGALRKDLDDAGLEDVDVTLELVPEEHVELPPGG